MTTLAQVFAEAEAEAKQEQSLAAMDQAAPFGWPGGKKVLKHRIIALIPPHKTYVEPFAGAASVFWAKEPAEIEVLNDIDPDLMRFYQNIGQVARCDTAAVAKDWDSLKARQDELTPCEFFSAVKCSFGQGMFKRGQALNHPRCTGGQPHFHKNLAEYQARLVQTRLHNENWEPVIRRYDAPDTFFYLDPPYHGTSRRYAGGGDKDVLARLAQVLPTLKGKWLLSYDDHPEVRAAFQGSYIRKVNSYYTIAAGDNNYIAKELLIANYPIERQGMEQDAHPDMSVIGPAAWAELHAWADRFAAKVGDSCSCGIFAQDAARAMHDVVNMKLGKPAMYPETLQEMANVFYGTAKSLRRHSLLMQEARGIARAKQAEMGHSPQEERMQTALFQSQRWPRPGKTFSSEAEARVWAKELQEPDPDKWPGGHIVPWQVDIFKWPAEWEPVEGEETWEVQYWTGQKNSFQVTQSSIYPWPEGMFDDEEEDEEEEGSGKAKRKKPTHLSQSFIDTILHTAIGTGVAIGVAKVLNPPAPSIIKEEEKPQEPPSPTPAVLSPAHVEGDQANVDLGTLLEEIDAILKKPETMGIVDADTLTIVRG